MRCGNDLFFIKYSESDSYVFYGDEFKRINDSCK